MASAYLEGFVRDTVTGALLVSGAADNDNGQAGMYAPSSPGWYPAVAAAVAGRATGLRFVPARDMTLVGMTFEVTTLGADVACDVAITDAAASPNKLIASANTTGVLNSTGLKQLNFTAPYTVRANVTYYAGFSCAAGSTAVLLNANWPSALSAALAGTAVGQTDLIRGTANPWPAALTVASQVTAAPLLFLRET